MDQPRTEEAIAERLLVLVRSAAVEIADQLAQLPDALDSSAVLFKLHGVEAMTEQALWERRAAEDILFALRIGDPAEVEDTGRLDEEEIDAPLQADELDGPFALANQMLVAVEASDANDWDRGSLLHHGHIGRGKVFLRRGDMESAAHELRSTGRLRPRHSSSLSDRTWLSRSTSCGEVRTHR